MQQLYALFTVIRDVVFFGTLMYAVLAVALRFLLRRGTGFTRRELLITAGGCAYTALSAAMLLWAPSALEIFSTAVFFIVVLLATRWEKFERRVAGPDGWR